MITIEHLKKTYGEKVALDIEQYTVQEGDLLGLVGNNGAGKTTLFRLLLDLLRPDNGSASIDNTDVSMSEEWKKTTGAYIDDSFLIDYLTPEEYFYFVGKMYNLTKEEIDERLVHYEQFMHNEIIGQKKYIRNFSAGNKQKIGIIAAMLHEPKLLILDEPFNFLDPSSQSAIKHLLKEYNERTHATILVSSHNLNHTAEISKHIVLLEDGKIIRDIDNAQQTAEKELEDYFEIRKISPESVDTLENKL
ncbi:MAG: ABC transporter ATP-binding protein [Bacteroidaceae bacterium]|nr:ABC transporter ATP-binding protein [Bacteroidaceae bacterium]